MKKSMTFRLETLGWIGAVVALLLLVGCSESNSDTDGDTTNFDGDVEEESGDGDVAGEEESAENPDHDSEGEITDDPGEADWEDEGEGLIEEEMTEEEIPSEAEETAEEEIEEEIPVIEPTEDFYTGPDADYGLFQFKGRINTRELFESNHATQGIGEFTSYLGENEMTVDDNLVASLTVIPEDYSIEEMRGKEYMRLSGYVPRSSSATEATYWSFSAGLPMDGLKAVRDTGVYLATMPSLSWFNLMDVNQTVRMDGSVFLRYCYTTYADRESTQSKLFLDFSENTEFTAGENLIVWANVDLVPEIEITPEIEETACLFFMDDEEVSMETYYEEIVKDGTELDCDMPPNFFTPISQEYATLRMIAPINDFNSDDSSEPGLSHIEVIVDGLSVVVDDYQALAGRFIDEESGLDILYLYTLGGIEQLAPNDYLFNMLEVVIGHPDLLALGEDEYELVNTATDYHATVGLKFYGELQVVTQKKRGATYYFKHCPTAVSDLATSRLFVCHEAGDLFAVGDEFQTAANLVLLTDPTTVQNSLSLTAACYCTINDQDSYSCDDFESL